MQTDVRGGILDQARLWSDTDAIVEVRRAAHIQRGGLKFMPENEWLSWVIIGAVFVGCLTVSVGGMWFVVSGGVFPLR